MKIKKPYIEFLYKDNYIIIPVSKGEERVMDNFVSSLIIEEGKDYEIIIKKQKTKRSLDANAYFWVLVDKIAAKTHQSTTDVYKNIVRECGVFQIMPIRDDAMDKWKEVWQQRGAGWICENIGACHRLKGYHNIKCYFGTSVYSVEEMTRVIEEAVMEAKELGIETMTPDEIMRLSNGMDKITPKDTR